MTLFSSESRKKALSGKLAVDINHAIIYSKITHKSSNQSTHALDI